MGVGMPPDILTAVGHGIDMFDCVIPTRNARNGQVFTWGGKITIKNARYKDDARPLEEGCACTACRGAYSRAYLRHLYLQGETLVLSLMSEHNLHFYGRLMAGARESVVRGDFAQWSAAKLSVWADSAA
jgi:queuine tRNA-ribosyltransferase